ncbi:MAG TPA: DUF5808 domain-containing protein [Candidatus Solibacter sp.]|nr:DUF5808 domain-containing protein [Candidatus Solibacter sp.]
MKSILIVTSVLESAIMLALPYLSPRPIYFGVRTGSAFRDTPFGRSVRTQYTALVLLFAAIAAGFLIFTPGPPEWMPGIAAMLPIFLSLAAFLRAYFQVRPHALATPEVREAELTPESDALPRWTWLALPPFTIPLAVMLYLRAHWDEIPARFPQHFGTTGEPDRWAAKSERTVFGPIWFCEGMMFLFLLLFAAVILGSRRSIRRSAMPGIFVVVMYLIAVMFTATVLMPIVQVPPFAMMGVMLAFVVAALVVGYRRNSGPRAPVEPTPDECWTLGSFYVNSNDPAIFVQKRIGFGYTINFGNVWSYVVMGAFFLGMLGLTQILK